MYAIACGCEDCDDPEISFKTLEKGVSSMAINLTSQNLLKNNAWEALQLSRTRRIRLQNPFFLESKLRWNKKMPMDRSIIIRQFL